MTTKLPPDHKIRPLVLWVSLLLASSASAQTVITTYTDLPTFTTAIGAVPVTVETFTASFHFPISTGVLNSATNLPAIGIVPGTIQPGVTYSTAIGTGNFFNIDGAGGFASPYLDTVTSVGPLTITFNGTASAFGFDTNTLMGSAFDIVINFTNATAYTNTIPLTSSSPTFYGFQSTSSNISSIVLVNNGVARSISFAIDNFRFTNSNVSAIPEPGTVTLLGGGFIGLLLLHRRRLRAGMRAH